MPDRVCAIAYHEGHRAAAKAARDRTKSHNYAAHVSFVAEVLNIWTRELLALRARQGGVIDITTWRPARSTSHWTYRFDVLEGWLGRVLALVAKILALQLLALFVIL